MELLKNNFFKRIIISLLTFIMMFNFFILPSVNAASVKTQMGEGQFYYSGTTTGSYIPSQNIFSWLLEKIGEIVDFLLGLMTMGGRMVFVGWTALFEELITWLLEASSGIPMDIENDVNATSTDGFISSSNNVTIEAIVYNQVPILNANLFERQKAKCVSGTGKFFVVCETCYNAENPVVEEDNTNRNMYAPKPTTIIGKNQKVCKMEECKCPECWETLKEAGYLETDAAGNIVLDDEGFPVRKGNAVTVIKDAVSKWYYVLRLIALAAMLLVLLVIGIKMAISNIASDKALYKRMLVDWLVGMILLFLIHYFMVLVVGMNDVFVDFIKNTKTGMNEVVKKEFYLDNKSDSDIEIGIYQAVRTRAYDPKLINGTTGTILYVTLVFYTIRFVFAYLKRYLTIIILTLLAPGVAFSYALQKVLTGKGKSLSKWMNEYFINIFVQTVHALVYTIFVSTALIISLNSVSGMIIAFICINFMLKADDIFRKIFKMSSSSVDDAMNAASAAKGMIGSAKSAATFMTAGNLLKNSPITKAATAPLRMAGREGILAASRIHSDRLRAKNSTNTENDDNEKINRENQDTNINKNAEFDNIIDSLQRLRKNITPEGESNKDFKNAVRNRILGRKLGADEEDAIEKELLALEKEIAAGGKFDEKDIIELQKVRSNFDKLTNISVKDAIKNSLNRFLDDNNYYERNEKGERGKRRIGFRGKRRFDRENNVWVRDTMDNLIAEQLKVENLLGWTEKDKKLWNETTSLFKGTLLGMGSMFVGLGTVVSNPAIGMGLLVSGMNSQIKFWDEMGVFDPKKNYRAPTADEKQKKFSFNRFNKGAQQNIVRSILAHAENEKDAMVVENVRKNHKKLYKSLKLGGAGLVAVGALSLSTAGVGGALVLGAGAAAHVAGNSIKTYSGYSQKSLLGRINQNHFSQYKALRKQLLKDDIRLQSIKEQEELTSSYADLQESINAALEVPVTEEEKEKALELGNAVKTVNTETIMLITNEQKVEKASIKDSALLGIVDEVVAKTMIEKVLTTEKAKDLENFKTEDILKDAKELIEKRLVAQGVLKDGELDIKVKGIEKAIDHSAKNIIDKDIKGNKTSEEISAFDNALVNSVIEEKVATGEIKSGEDISTDSIMSSLKQKREQIISASSSGDVIAAMQKQGSNEQIGAEQAEFAEKIKVSEEKEDALRSGIIQIKRKNKPVPKTEDERRADKKKRIAALDKLLSEYAEGTGDFDKLDEQEKFKTADEVIQELFDKNEDRTKAAVMLENVQNMKKLNRRGTKAKMRKVSSDGSKEYTGGDGRRDLSKELYGPVTDIADLIKGLTDKKE